VSSEGADRLDAVDPLDRAEIELADVERALHRLDDGTYASCEVCGVAIGDDRLERSPVERRCVAHALRPTMPAGY
jgi:DnaK suppressor protein